MTGALVDELLLLEKGVVLYDSHLEKDVFVVAPVICFLADNARASELANHLGARAIKFCRKCMSSSSDNTHNVITKPLRDKMTYEHFIAELQQKETAKEKELIMKKHGLRNNQNPLFKLSVNIFSSTPVETLHTVLLGVAKYMLRAFMDKRSASEKKEILARIKAFPYCGFTVKITGNICQHYRSFIGRDFKAFLQMALFIITAYLTEDEEKCWILLSKVFLVAYCLPLVPENLHEYESTCQTFVNVCTVCMPEYAKRSKVHLLLHLVDDMIQFGPSSCFNTERYEAFNSVIRAQNIYGNRQSPSKDIATNFAIIEYLRVLCSGGYINDGIRCGQGLIDLFNTPNFQSFFNCAPMRDFFTTKDIYQPGSFRKLSQTAASKVLDIVYRDFYTKECTLSDIFLHDNGSIHLPDNLALDDKVVDYGAVMSQRMVLANKGDFVQISLGSNVVFGILAACCETVESNQKMCLVRVLDLQRTPNDQKLTDEYDCPLAMLTNKIISVSPLLIKGPVSIIHACTSSCSIIQSSSTAFFERELLEQQNKVIFKHDTSNRLFCVNIYCTGNYDH